VTEIATADLEDRRKALATLQARAALVGATIHRIEDDRGVHRYIVSKDHLTRDLPSLAAAAGWLACLVASDADVFAIEGLPLAGVIHGHGNQGPAPKTAEVAQGTSRPCPRRDDPAWVAGTTQ
jgi:hypothetical protein